MKKKIICCLAGLLLAGVLAGCGGQQETISEEVESTGEETAAEEGDAADEEVQEKISEAELAQAAEEAEKNMDRWLFVLKSPEGGPEDKLMEDIYGDYKEKGGEIAFVLDGNIMDESYNEAIYEGIRMYAFSAGVSFSYYTADANAVESYEEVIRQAVSNEAKMIVCGGEGFDEAVGNLQSEYPEICFLLIDGVPVNSFGSAVAIEDNVHCVSFKEEESGYLAGYLTVFDGYRKLGFIGGKETDAVMRYGYGYLQGIEDAVQVLGLTDVSVNYWYADSFEPGEEIRLKALKWYEDGTEVIFACGGFLYQSVLAAAEERDGLIIGVDTDQSGLSERFLTSAIKDITGAVVISLDDFYAEGCRWSEEFAGQSVRYDMGDNCTGIPIFDTEWRFSALTMEKFDEVHKKIKMGEISISDAIDEQPQVSFTLNTDEAED